MFLEGRATLTLTDDLTGKVVDQVTAKNIVTSAADEYLKYFMLGDPVENISGPMLTRNRSIFNILGGVMLFSEPIPDNATTRRGRGLETMAPYFIAGANQRNGYVTTSKLKNVGNISSINWEQVGNAIEYNQTWTFGNYVSGIIKSLSLTGSGVNPYDNSCDCILRASSGSTRYYIFWIEPSTVDNEWYAYIMRSEATGSGSSRYTVTIYKRRFYMPSVNTSVITLFDRRIEWIDVQGEIIFSEDFDNSAIGSLYWPPVYEYTDEDGYVHFCSMFSNGTYGDNLHVILHNGNVQVSKAALLAPAGYYLNGHTSYDTSADNAYPFDIRDGIIYYLSWYYGDEQHTTVYKRLIKAELSSDWNTISNPVVIKDGLPYDGGSSDSPRTTGLVRLNDGGLLILRESSGLNMYMDANDVISNPPLYFSHIVNSNSGTDYVNMPTLTKIDAYNSMLRGDAGSGVVHACKSYIGTICNLDTPITKSSNQTLTVHYKLRAV